MIVIPAIDIKNGRCVRLRQGRMNDETVFSDVPEEMAVRWVEQGAERLHLVDLDGAVRGAPINREVVRRIVDAVSVPVQLGGGIRDMSVLDAYVDAGVDYVILGTVAHKDPDFVAAAAGAYPGRIILGIDANQDRVALEGWTEHLTVSPAELAGQFEGAGVSAVIYTDIQRDGMQTGPNVEGTRRLAASIGMPVIASGGISGIDDVVRLCALEGDGVMGMITGRALYEGTLDLAEALRAARTVGRTS